MSASRIRIISRDEDRHPSWIIGGDEGKEKNEVETEMDRDDVEKRCEKDRLHCVCEEERKEDRR